MCYTVINEEINAQVKDRKTLEDMIGFDSDEFTKHPATYTYKYIDPSVESYCAFRDFPPAKRPCLCYVNVIKMARTQGWDISNYDMNPYPSVSIIPPLEKSLISFMQ